MQDMRINRRTLLRAVGAGAGLTLAVPILAACGGAASPTAVPPKPAAAAPAPAAPAPAVATKPAAAVKPAAVAAGAKPPVEIQWSTSVVNPEETLKTAQQGSGPWADSMGWKDTLDLFSSKFPNIKYKYISAPWGELLTKQQVAATGGNPGDVGYNEWGTEFAQLGIYEAIKLDELEGKFFPGTLEGHSYQGKVFGVPLLSGALALYWNKKLFEGAGLDPEKPPKDWAEYESFAAKLTDKAKNVYGTIVAGSGSTYGGQMRYSPFLWSAGGDFFDKDRAKVTWNEKAGVDAITLLSNISQKYAFPGTASSPEGQHADAWNAQQSAMFLDGPWQIPNSRVKKIEFGIAYVPPAPGGKPASLILGNAANALFTQSKNKDEAREFIKFQGTKEGQLAGMKYRTRMPSNKEAMEAAEVFKTDKDMQAFKKVFIEDNNHPLPVAKVNNWKIQSIFRKYLEIALLGKQTPKAAWDAAASESQEVLSGPEIKEEPKKA